MDLIKQVRQNGTALVLAGSTIGGVAAQELQDTTVSAFGHGARLEWSTNAGTRHSNASRSVFLDNAGHSPQTRQVNNFGLEFDRSFRWGTAEKLSVFGGVAFSEGKDELTGLDLVYKNPYVGGRYGFKVGTDPNRVISTSFEGTAGAILYSDAAKKTAGVGVEVFGLGRVGVTLDDFTLGAQVFARPVLNTTRDAFMDAGVGFFMAMYLDKQKDGACPAYGNRHVLR